MINSELISIIVPIYGVEHYLPKCVDSILAQTYSNIEILLVDDGSPDNSGVICDEYAARDSRIKVFHIPNGGVAKARQLGVESSAGEYIVFADPDDWLPTDSIMNLYQGMTADVDVVMGTYIRVAGKRERVVSRYRSSFTSDNMTDLILTQKVIHAPWGKIFRRTLFMEDSFPRFKKSQDWLMNIEVSTRARAIRFINTPVYYYFKRRESVVSTFRSNQDHELCFILTGKGILQKSGLFESNRVAFAHFAVFCLFVRVILRGRSKIELRDARMQEVLGDIIPYKLSLFYTIMFLFVRYPFIVNNTYCRLNF